MGGRIGGWTNRRVDVLVGGRMDGWTNRRMDV